jgi:hypothetical protein
VAVEEFGEGCCCRVTREVISLVPGVQLRVAKEATGPVERITP